MAREFRAKHSRIHQGVLRAIAGAPAMASSGDHLDVGSGTGELLRLVCARYPFRSFGCDYTDKLLSVPGPKIDALDERNAWAVRAMNSPGLLLGRTLIVTAVKPA